MLLDTSRLDLLCTPRKTDTHSISYTLIRQHDLQLPNIFRNRCFDEHLNPSFEPTPIRCGLHRIFGSVFRVVAPSPTLSPFTSYGLVRLAWQNAEPLWHSLSLLSFIPLTLDPVCAAATADRFHSCPHFPDLHGHLLRNSEDIKNARLLPSPALEVSKEVEASPG